MHNTVVSAITSCGGAASYRALDRLGVDRRRVAAAIKGGAIIRVRARWFATPEAPADVLRAVRVGGTLTGASVARIKKLWTMDDEQLHVRVASTASRLASPNDRMRVLDAEHKVCVHYSALGGTDVGCDPLPMALAEMFNCGTVKAAIVAIDSALNRRLLRLDELEGLRSRVPRRLRRHLDRVDPGAQSGLETLVRLLLRSRNIRFRSQVDIAGVGRVDLLIGDRLVLETDVQQFHSGGNFEMDRRRDLALIMRGYVVLRLSYRQIMREWPEVEASLLELVSRGEHRWGGSRQSAPADWAFTG